MRITSWLVGMSLVLAVPASAQPTPSPEATAQAQADADLRSQISAFKYVLRDAVERGGQQLAEWAGQIVPGVQLAFSSNPVVDATPLPESGVLFNVRVPEIMQTSMFLMQLRQRPQTGATPVAVPPGRVGATGIVPSDPMAVPVRRGADEQYSDFVRAALIDAIVDSSRILAMDNGQWLTVAASGVEEVANPLYRNSSRKLILSIKSDDLRALRSGVLTREEAKARIVERRF